MIIALTGYAGSGKSTAAKHLVDRHGFTLVKFAGPLKSMLRCLGLGDREIEGDLKEQPHPVLNYKTPRYAMQTLGTEWGRGIVGESIWVKTAMRRAFDALDAGAAGVVVPDVRFLNEAAAIRQAGGVVWRMQRDGAGIAGNHASEAGIPDEMVDRLIVNNGDIDQLEADVCLTLTADMRRRAEATMKE